MMNDRNHSPNIIHLMRLARADLVSTERSILATHFKACIHDAFHTEDDIDVESKTSEIVKFVQSLIE